MTEPSVSSIAIYQLRVVLCGVSPLVWRRLLVVSTTSIAELHEILQSAFGWSGEHLHRFLIHGAAYGIPHLGGIVFREDARGVPLFRHASTEGELRRRKIVLEPGIISSGCIGTEATFPSMRSSSWSKPCGGFLIPMATATLSAISTNCAKRRIAGKPTRISNQTGSIGENSTSNCGRWPKIVRCGDDLQDSSRYRQRRRPQRDTRDHLDPTDRCEAGDAGPNLGRGQNDIERPAAGRSRISGVELAVA